MKKNLILTLLFLIGFTSIQAQTDKGRIFLGVGSVAGFSSSSIDGIDDNSNSFSVNLTGGLFVIDNLLAGANVGFGTSSFMDFNSTSFSFRPFARYYMNNFFAGAGLGLASTDTDDVRVSGTRIGLELGYAAFLNDHISIEPVLSYSLGGGDFDGNNQLSLSVGLGIYLP